MKPESGGYLHDRRAGAVPLERWTRLCTGRRKSVLFLFPVLLSAWAEPPDPVAEQARIEQVEVPRWQARAETARRQLAAREGWFAGEVPFEAAFPGLVDARLGNRAGVRGRLSDLQTRATAREAERLSRFDVPEQVREAVLAERSAALDAEEAADGLLRRFLTRVEAVLAQRPELSDVVVEGLLVDERALLASATPEDPQAREAHDVAVARADMEISRTRRLQRDLILAALGGPVPEAREDLGRDDPLAASRLWMLRTALEGEDREAVDAALAGFVDGAAVRGARAQRDEAVAERERAATDPVESSAEALEQQRIERAREVETLTAALAVLPEGEPLRQLRSLELEVAQARLATVVVQQDRLADKEAARSEAAAVAAAKARREAELAAAEAKGDLQQIRAKILGRSADASERLEALTARVEARSEALEAVEAAHAERIAAHQAELAEIVRASPIPGTGPDADAVYEDLRDRIQALSMGPAARGEGLAFALEEIAEVRVRVEDERAEIDGIESFPAIVEPLGEWSDLLDSEREVADELKTLAERERKSALRRINDLATLRRRLRDYISRDEADVDASRLPEEVVQELTLLEPTVIATVSTRVSDIVSSPWRLIRDGRLMLDLLGSLFWTALLLGAWSWARGKAGDVAGRLAWQVRRLRPDLRPLDLQSVKPPLAVVVRAAIDLGLGYLMVGLLAWIAGEIAFVVECWLLFAIYRFFVGLYDLVAVRSPDFRPGLFLLAPDAYDLPRLTTRVLVIWGIARGFTAYVTWGMLGMDATTILLMTLFNAAGYVLAAWLLYRWDPLLRERIRARNQESRVVRFLSADVPWSILRPFSALAMLAFFSVTRTVDLTYWLLARDSGGLGRVFNFISRYQMGGDELVSTGTVDEELKARLVGQGIPATYVNRPGLDSSLDEALTGWHREHRRGMVALIGDRGDGKRTEIERFLKRVGEEEVVHHRFAELEIDPCMLVRELARIAGVEETESADELVKRLEERPRAVFVLEQLHRTFTRTVGGFEGISTVLYVLNATSDHHFWLVSLHRPGWRYLASIPSIVDVGVFRSVVNLEPMDAASLRTLAEKRVGQAGHTLDYSTLMRGNLLGSDPAIELERATSTFFRLLADASEGNPRVAMHLFADCVQPVPDSQALSVHRRKALATDVLDGVSVYGLFALVALRQQDAMRLPELVSVTNLPESVLRNLVRDLQSRGLVAAHGELLYVPIQRLALVTRTLRRRHLLYLGA